MPRKPGTPKTGGRKTGTPNKNNLPVRERLEAAMGAGWCPIVALAEIGVDPEVPLDLRVRCLSEVAPYMEPKKRAVEHTGGRSLEELVAASMHAQAGAGAAHAEPATPAPTPHPEAHSARPAAPAAGTAAPTPQTRPFRMPVDPDAARAGTPSRPDFRN